jgi:hypothetical protein
VRDKFAAFTLAEDLGEEPSWEEHLEFLRHLCNLLNDPREGDATARWFLRVGGLAFLIRQVASLPFHLPLHRRIAVQT